MGEDGKRTDWWFSCSSVVLNHSVMRSIFMRGEGVGDRAITALLKGFGSMLPFDKLLLVREKWEF